MNCSGGGKGEPDAWARRDDSCFWYEAQSRKQVFSTVDTVWIRDTDNSSGELDVTFSERGSCFLQSRAFYKHWSQNCKAKSASCSASS